MKLLRKLIDIHGVSGREDRVRKLISRHIKPYVSEVRVDDLGNLIAHKKGKVPRVMLAAHMDEIGLIVKGVDTTGKFFLSAIGGIEPAFLVGQVVTLDTKKGRINGIITTKEMTNDRELKDLPNMDDLRVDTGLTKKEVEHLGIEIGTYLSLEQDLIFLGHKDIISGKALDDRIGCYILLELAKRLRNVKQDVYYVFTTQEELGLYGAKTSAYEISPDWAIAIDVTRSNDFEEHYSKAIGHGPCITVKDSDMISNRCINDWLKMIAKKKNIPYQLDVSDGGTTDALSISLSKGGVPTTSVGVAIRNMHTTVGIASRKDIENTIKLLELLLKNPPKTCFN